MVDFAAGHLSSAQSHPIVAALDAALGNGRDGVRFHPGVEYRHLCVVPTRLGRRASARRRTISPGSPRCSRPVRRRRRCSALMDASRAVVRDAARAVGSSATQIWLWGQGVKPALPRFDDDVRRRRPHVVGGRSRAGSRRAHRHRGRRRARRDRRLRQRLRARRRARASIRSPIATCSCCTSRRPTRPGTRVSPT